VEFGETLARFRRNVGITPSSLARAVGLDPQGIERIERGEARNPDRQLVLDLARALNLSDAQTDELLWSANHLPHKMRYYEPFHESRDEHKVALFVDHENVYIALSELLRTLPPEVQLQERRKIEPSWLAFQMRNAAEQIGFVKVALAVADWERLPSGQVKEYLKHLYQIDYNLPGRNSADLKLSDAIRNVLEQDENDDIDSYVLVTGDGGYLTVLETLLRRQKRVYVWGVRGAASALLQQHATGFSWIDDLIGLSASRCDADGARTNHVVACADNSAGETLGLPVGNDVSRLEALAIHLSKYLRVRSWSFITFVRLLAFFDETGVFGQNREEQLAWLSHAKETGVLREEIVDDPADPSRIARRFSLNESHPMVKRAQLIRLRIGEIVPATGRGVAFGVVVDRLLNDPQLQLTDVQAKNWLTWFHEAGYLQAEQVPHFRKEGVTVTLLHQVPGAFDLVAPTDGETDHERMQRASEFAVLRLANFLERHPHFGWMALSQLLNRMAAVIGADATSSALLSRQDAKQAIALAEESGYLRIEQIPNVKTGGMTTVAHLNREDSRVAKMLATRDVLIRRLAEMLVSRPGVARATFQASIVDGMGLCFEEAGAWIDFLISDGIFILDLDHDGSPGVLRTDQRDLIVSRVLFRATPVPNS
jgi:transcriptional regulator with XRE-family HTH domain